MNDIVERLKPGRNQLDALESQERLGSVMAETPRSRPRGRTLLAAGGAAAILCVGVAVAINSSVDDHTGTDSANPASPPLPLGEEGECQPRLRVDGVVYLATGYLENADPTVTPIGRAELSACDDEGPSPKGGYFPEQPETAPAFAFDGQPVGTVVGIEFPTGYEVYVAERVPASQRQEILELLEGLTTAK